MEMGRVDASSRRNGVITQWAHGGLGVFCYYFRNKLWQRDRERQRDRESDNKSPLMPWGGEHAWAEFGSFDDVGDVYDVSYDAQGEQRRAQDKWRGSTDVEGGV